MKHTASLCALLAAFATNAALAHGSAEHAKPCVEQTNAALDKIAQSLPKSYARWSTLQRYQALDAIDTVRRVRWAHVDHDVVRHEAQAASIRKADDAEQARRYAALAQDMNALKDHKSEKEARSTSHLYWTLYKIDALGAHYSACLSKPVRKSKAHDEQHKTESTKSADTVTSTSSNQK